MSGQSDLKELVRYLEANKFSMQAPFLRNMEDPYVFGARIDRKRLDKPFIMLPYTKRDVRCTFILEPFETKAIFISVNPTNNAPKFDASKQVLSANYKVRDEAVLPTHKYEFLLLNTARLKSGLNDATRDYALAEQHGTKVLQDAALHSSYSLMQNLGTLCVWTDNAASMPVAARGLFKAKLGDQNLANPVGMLDFIDKNYANLFRTRK